MLQLFLQCTRCLLLVGFALFLHIQVGASQQVPQQSGPSGPASEPPPLSDRITRLEDRQSLLLDAVKNDNARVFLFFSAISAFFGMFMIFNAVRTVLEDRRRGRIEDQHLQHVRAMMTSFGENVGKINSFISTLTGTFSVQADLATRMKAVDDRLGELDKHRKNADLVFQSQIDHLNTDYAAAFVTCELDERNRESFKKEENRVLLQALSARMDTISISGDAKNALTPVCFFLRALSRFNEMRYKEAIQDLVDAKDLANSQMATTLLRYGGWSPEQIKSNLSIISGEVNYHLGIIRYNTGIWKQAQEDFQQSFKAYKLDFRSRVYVPELMFFDDTSDPAEVERKFLEIEQELNNVSSSDRRAMSPSWEAAYSALKIRQGNLYIRKLVLPEGRSSKWSSLLTHDSDKRALTHYLEAREKTSSNPSPFLIFSQAQAMEYSGKSLLWKDFNPQQLFHEAFLKFRNQAVSKTEPILLTLLNYSAAICCHYAQVPGESPSTYFFSARQNLQRIPENILVFSPISKLMVSHQNLVGEMEQLERDWQRSRRI